MNIVWNKMDFFTKSEKRVYRISTGGCMMLKKKRVMRAVTFFALLPVAFFFRSVYAGAEVTLMPADYLQEMISDHTVDFDFILIDVRDDIEVEGGIIASKYCKPYHMSWNTGVLSEKYTLLPKTTAIVVYCRSGSRSLQAANFLLEKGFTQVASITGGINSYTGTLSDSTEFKPLEVLPTPSYLGDTSTSVTRLPRKQQAVLITAMPRDARFDLQGRSLSSQPRQRNAPVYILERIGENSRGSVQGIFREPARR